MKKRNLFILLLSLVLAGCLGLGLVACKDTDDKQYTVTFSLGEYTGDESAPDPIKADENEDITLPDVEISWDGHIFSGWKEGSEGSLLEAGSTYTVTKSTTLTAQWEDDIDETTYTINYMVGDVNISRMGGPYKEGEVGTAIGTLPTLEDIARWAPDSYDEFKGWSTVLDSESHIVGADWEPVAGLNLLYAIFTGVSNEAPTLTFYASEEDRANPITVTPEWKKPHEWSEEAWCFEIPACTFTNGEKDFVCWYYHADTFMGAMNLDLDGTDGVVELGDLETFATGYEYMFFAKWDDGTVTNPPAGESDWVEFTGEVDADYYGNYYALSPIVWMLIDVNGVDTTLKYKVKGDSTEYTATAVPDQNEGNKLCYKLTDFGSGPYSVPHILVEVSTDKTELDIYTTQGDKCGTLTVGGSTPGPVEPPPAGDSKSIGYKHGTNAPASLTDIFPNVTSGVPGTQVTIPAMSEYDISHYTFKGWDAYKATGDYDSTIGRVTPGVAFTMPDYPIIFESVFTINYVTVKFNSNGGEGTMADITNTYRYNSSTVISVGSKFKNTFTNPNGASFLYWSTSQDGAQIPDNFVFNEANGVTTDDILTLYAIWDTTSVTPGPGPEGQQNIDDFVGKWSTELVSGNHTITVIAQSGEYDLVGYAVLDGKTFITIWNVGGTLVASNTDNDYVSNYTFALSDNTFVFTVTDAHGAWEATHNFTKKESVPSTAESTFLGKWTRSATQKVLIAEDGVAYYTNQGIKNVEWILVGEYAVFSYTASNSFDYYYILTKSGANLAGYFLAPDATQAAVTFTANGFYTLKVDGEYVEFVNEGSKPTAIAEPTAPAGKKFDGWVLAGTETPFNFNENMTADASIEAKFVDDNGSEEPEPTPAAGEYTGGSFTYIISFSSKPTVTSFTFNDDFSSVKLYMQDGSTVDRTLDNVTGAGWLGGYIPNGSAGAVAIYEMTDAQSNSYYFCFYDDSKNSAKVYSEDDELLATFTK